MLQREKMDTNNCAVCDRPKGKNKICCSAECLEKHREQQRKTCVVCGEKYKKNKICCSIECRIKYRQQWKTCVVCGEKFPDPQSNNRKCCSKECSTINRKNMGTDEAHINTLKNLRAAGEAFAKAHTGEKEVNSKYWEIQSHDGTIYKCQNLKHFIRTHQDLFDGTVEQARSGFSMIKSTAQGKREKNPVYSWKGWKLLDWSDDILGVKD